MASNSDELCQELFETLDNDEKKLVETHTLVYTEGKKGRHVPVLTTEMQDARWTSY